MSMPTPAYWKWMVLGAFCLNSFCNSYSFMDFNTVPDVTKQLFGFCEGVAPGDACGGDTFVGNTYAAILFSVIPTLFPVLKYIGERSWLTTIVCMTCQCIGAWLRWVSCIVGQRGHYDEAQYICLASSAFIGIGAAVIITSYSFLSQRWFPEEERTLTTTIAVMSNYAGWCLGCLLIPWYVTDADRLTRMQLYQAIVMSAAYLLLVLVYREGPAVPVEDKPKEHHAMCAELGLLARNRQYILQCFCYSMLTGVAFSVPGFGTEALSSLSLDNAQSSWLNFAFVFSGVTAGTVMGKMVKKPSHFPRVLKGAFVVTSVGLLGVVLLVFNQNRLSAHVLYGLLVLCMCVSGAASLGFIGIGLSAVIETTYPVDPEYSGGVVELFVQLWGGVFVYASGLFTSDQEKRNVFLMVAIPTWVTTVLMFTAYRQDYLKTPRGHGQLKEPLVSGGGSVDVHVENNSLNSDTLY